MKLSLIGVVAGAISTTSATSSSSSFPWNKEFAEEAQFLQPSDANLRNNGDVSLGASVAAAAQGTVLLVGAPPNVRKTNSSFFSDYSATNGGAAYVYTTPSTTTASSSSSWMEQTILTSGETMTDEGALYWPLFGTAVALSENGEMALVGAPLYSPCTFPNPCLDYATINATGAAYVFHLSQGGNPSAKLLPPDDDANENAASAARFGYAVALSGSTALVGPYVFWHDGNSWAFQDKLLPTSTNVTDHDGSYGYAVALQGDTALVAGGTTVYVFVRQTNVNTGHVTWVELGQLVTSGSSHISSIAIDGDTAMLGSNTDSAYGWGNPGAAFAFSTLTWTETQKITGRRGHGFGVSVSISGKVAVIGDTRPVRVMDGTGGGRAFLFLQASNGTWVQQDLYDPLDTQEGYLFGANVCVNGNTAVVGTGTYIFANYETNGGKWTSVAHVINISNSTPSEAPSSAPTKAPQTASTMQMCAANPKCNELSLQGECCPTSDNWILDCCLENGVQRVCQANPRCDALGLVGACCPTQDRVNGDRFLDCCEAIDSNCHATASDGQQQCEVLSARDYLAELEGAEGRNESSARATKYGTITLLMVFISWIRLATWFN